MLDAAIDGGLDAIGVQAGLDFFLHAVHEAFQVAHLGLQRRGDLLIAGRVQVLEGQVLQLPLGPLHAQAVGDGGIDFHGLQGFGALFIRRLVGHGAHIVKPVGDLDEDDADVLGHGHKHLTQIFHLLILFAGVLNPGQLGDALHNIRHRVAELAGNVIMGQVGVLDHIVKQGGDDGILVQAHVHGNIRRGHAVGHIGGAVLPELAGMGQAGHVIGGPDAPQVHAGAGFLDLGDEIVKHFIRIKELIGFFFLLIHICPSPLIYK